MLAGAAGSVDFETDAEMIGPNLAGVEQAAEQRVLRARDRVKWAGAVECVGKVLRPQGLRAPAPIFDLDAVRSFMRPDDAPGDDLKPSLGTRPRDDVGDFGRNTVTMNVPPVPHMTQEAALLVAV